jgi:hypothetical protein
LYTRLHAHDDKRVACDVDGVARAVFYERRLDVLDSVAGQAFVTELEDDAVVALVVSDGDTLEQRGRARRGRPDSDVRPGAFEWIGLLVGCRRRGHRRRARRRRLALARRRRAAATRDREQGTREEKPASDAPSVAPRC